VLATAILLGLLAVALAWPVPILLARSKWPLRAPGSALLAWQAVALAGGLSMIGTLAVFGLRPFGPTLSQAVGGTMAWIGGREATPDVDTTAIVALSVAVLLAIHLLLTLAVTWAHTERVRHRHRALVALLGTASPNDPTTRVLDVSAPVAYCLPGGSSLTVLSTGLVQLLDQSELAAVVAHERGHALQRHHLVLVTFRAWHKALPWLPTATLAENAVTRLVELLADDFARHSVDDTVLRQAILRVTPATGPVDLTSGCCAGPLSLVRAERLAMPGFGLRLRYRGLVAAAAFALVCLPPALLVTQH
jgi:Zn-dependent protease with chaperone function